MKPAAKAVVLGALALSLAACAPGGGIGPAAGSATAPEPTVPGTDREAGPVVVGLGGFAAPGTLNPLLDGPDTAVLDLIGGTVFAGAHTADPATGGLVPDALTAIPSVANGGVVPQDDGTLAVTYRVSPTARWSDGEPVTAADLAFTCEVVGNPALPIRRDVRARHAAVVRGSVVADGLTLRLVMQGGGDPAGLFAIILPAHQVAGSDFVNDWNDRMWVGAGPYAFASWVPGQYLLVRRNPYYDEGEGRTGPALGAEEVAFRFFGAGEESALAAAFASRLVEVAVLPAGADLSPYSALGDAGAILETAPGRSWQALVFQFGAANRNAASLNSELRFRQAVAHALDREALAAARGGTPPGSIYGTCRPDLAGGAWDGLAFDAARAQALLRDLGEDLGMDLGERAGPPVLLSVPANDVAGVALAEEVGDMLRAAGIPAEVQVEEAAAFYGDTLVDGRWDVAVLTFACACGLGPAGDLARWFDPAAWPPGEGNPGRWGAVGSASQEDPAAVAYARVMAGLAATADAGVAAGLLRRAESLLAEAVVLLPLAVTGRMGVAYWPDAVPATGLGATAAFQGFLGR